MENHSIEYKQKWRDEFLKVICSFANTEGGVIYVGVDDNGKTVGISNIKKSLEDIPSKIVNHLGVVCDVEHSNKDGLDQIIISVPPFNIPISYHGKYYKRVGSTTQELTGISLSEFLLFKSGISWEDTTEKLATTDDISSDAIALFISDATKVQRVPESYQDWTKTELLQNLRLLKQSYITRAGVLLFGLDPRSFSMGAYIKIGKFGETDSDLIAQDIIEGSLYQMAQKTLDVLDKKYFTTEISYHGLNRVEHTEYPYAAIREILLNAIVHKAYENTPVQISVYENKVVFWNQGILPDQLSVEDLKKKHASYPRNPKIADVFFKAGLIESWGRGFLKIYEECINNGLPSPLIEEVNGGLSVTLFKDIYNISNILRLKINERQKKALLHWKSKGVITNGEYKEYFDITDKTARRDLLELVELNLLTKQGERKASKYYFNS